MTPATVDSGARRRAARMLVCALTTFAIASAILAPAAAALKGKAIKIAGVSELLDVACPPAGACVATGLGIAPGTGFAPMVIVPISNGIPGKATIVPGTTAATSALACPKTNYCIAVSASGGTEEIVPIHHGQPGTPVPVSGVFVGGLGCGSSGSCWAQGVTPNTTQTVLAHVVGTVITHLYPLYPTSVFSPTELHKPTPACASATSCTLVGSANSTVGPGLVWSVHNGKVTGTRKISAVPRLNQIACTSASFCVIVGAKVSAGDPSGGMVLTLSKGKLGPAKPASGVLDLGTVGCETAAVCFAFDAGDRNAVVPIHNGKPAKPISIVPQISDVTCGKHSCLAVGSSGVNPSQQGVVYPFS